MTAPRIYTVRLNVDMMAAGLDTMDSDRERSAWLRGFQTGCRGAASKWPEGSPAATGYVLGFACYEEARDRHTRQAEGGHASAETRKAANGTAQPKPRPEVKTEGTSNSEPKVLRTTARSEPRSEGRTAAEPIHVSMDPCIQKPDIQKPEESAARDSISGLQTWVNWNGKDPAKAKENRAEVAGLVEKYGRKAVQAAAERVVHRLGDKCWPNHLLPEILAALQPDPAPAAPEPIQDVVRLWPRKTP